MRHDPSRRGVIDDGVLTANIRAKLAEDPQIRALNIKVETVNGMVKLSGVASNRADTERIISLVRTVNGVDVLKSDLRVNRP